MRLQNPLPMADVLCACGDSFAMSAGACATSRKMGYMPVCKACQDRHNAAPGQESVLLPSGRVVPSDEILLKAFGAPGATYASVAERFGCNRSDVFRARRKAGLCVPRPKNLDRKPRLRPWMEAANSCP